MLPVPKVHLMVLVDGPFTPLCPRREADWRNMGHGAPGCGPPTMMPLELLLEDELEDEALEDEDDEDEDELDELLEDDELLDALDAEEPPLPPPELALEPDDALDALEDEEAASADPPVPPPAPPPLLDDAPDDDVLTDDPLLVVPAAMLDAAGDEPHPAASANVDAIVDANVMSAPGTGDAKDLFVPSISPPTTATDRGVCGGAKGFTPTMSFINRGRSSEPRASRRRWSSRWSASPDSPSAG
jgi:hypothetical protein